MLVVGEVVYRVVGRRIHPQGRLICRRGGDGVGVLLARRDFICCSLRSAAQALQLICFLSERHHGAPLG